MKANAIISEMTDEELNDAIAEKFELFRKLKMNHAVSPLENPLQLKEERRKIAKLKTEKIRRAAVAAQNS